MKRTIIAALGLALPVGAAGIASAQSLEQQPPRERGRERGDTATANARMVKGGAAEPEEGGAGA